MTDPTAKPSNPKDLIGSDKLPLHLWPATATAIGSLGCLDGMLKYGRTNWRSAGVRASIYVDALQRHLNAWFDEGEETDPDSGLDHWSHILACAAIIVDARAAGKLTDDRCIRGGYRKTIEDLTPHVKRLKKQHASKKPKHYTIADTASPIFETARRAVDGEACCTNQCQKGHRWACEREAGHTGLHTAWSRYPTQLYDEGEWE
jgi:hypothetical protein